MHRKVSELRKILGHAAKNETGRRFHSLYDKISCKEVIWTAWLQVKANGGSGGVDGAELSDYEDPEDRNNLLREIHRELLTGNYRPQPVRREYIEKPDGGKRPLGIPTIKDRIVQTAVKLVLEPVFESDFQEFSYGFRPNRSGHQALQAVRKWMNIGHHQVVDADISKYFDTIPHDKLLRSVAKRVSDGRILRLIKLWLKTPINENGKMIPGLKGTPQGGVISPLLANIYLNHLDRFWVKKGYIRHARIVRYADDSAPGKVRTRWGNRSPAAGLRRQAANHRERRWLRARVVSVTEKAGQDSVRCETEKTNASEPPMKRRKRMDDVKTGRQSLARDKLWGNPLTARAASGVKVA